MGSLMAEALLRRNAAGLRLMRRVKRDRKHARDLAKWKPDEECWQIGSGSLSAGRPREGG